VAISWDFGFSVTFEERALKRTEELSAFDCYQTDTCVCPKQRAGRVKRKRNSCRNLPSIRAAPYFTVCASLH
jgi:hypothetical protein